MFLFIDCGKNHARRFFQGRLSKLLRLPFIAGDEQCGAVEELPEQLVQLPLELCRIRVKGLTCQLTNSISLLPSFMHRLEGFLLALQLRHIFPLSPGASPVPANLVSLCLTFSHKPVIHDVLSTSYFRFRFFQNVITNFCPYSPIV